jgi:hypothetical protein
MIATKYIYLAPNFPDEGAGDEHDWTEYPGRVVAGVLSEILRDLGCQVDAPVNMDFVGWELDFTYEGVQLWARVGAINDFLIVLGAQGLFDLFGRRKRVFAQFLERLEAALGRDARFSNIRWYTKQQMDAGEWAEGSAAARRGA